MNVETLNVIVQALYNVHRMKQMWTKFKAQLMTQYLFIDI